MRTPILAAALFSGAFLGQLQESSSTANEPLEVRELRIVDSNGDAKVVLSVDEHGDGRVEVLGPNGGQAHLLGFDRGHAIYDLHGPAAEGDGRSPRVRVTTDSAGGGALEVMNGEGAPVALVGATPEGDGGVRVSTGDGERAFYVGDNLRGNGVLPANARNGRRIVD